ncbi:MAG TPA: hypothetical protein VD862_00380 [Candidatus Paceibacterota bacterium]|nr:hypothetical protein [Candidatus Paceibacterota bacterium]
MAEPKGHTKTQLKESYLLCSHCDGRWVDASPRTCACGAPATSRDFLLCFACALKHRRCQHCGKKVHVKIDSC